MKPIVLLTDFGQQDGYVGIMKGVIKGIYPEAQIIDLAHDLPPQSVEAGRFVLWNSYKYFPKGSIFVAVVDPGVGSDRKIHVYQTADYIFIVPDNGIIEYVLSESRIRYAFELEHPNIRRSSVSQTFHGRDLFAPAAAHLAKGFVITQVGPSLSSYRIPPSPFLTAQAEIPLEGNIIHVDHYGNLISNIKVQEGESGFFQLGETRIPTNTTYASVSEGELTALPGSHGLWEIAVRNGNATEVLAKTYGDSIIFHKQS